MPLAPEIAAILAQLADDETSQRPTETDLAGARASHEHDAAEFSPPRIRAEVAAIETTRLPGPGGPVPLRIYRPRLEDTAMLIPVVLWFHGGGWTTGSLETGDILARAVCHHTPAVVVAVDYRLAPEHPWPAATDDALAALGWLSEHIGELGGDPTRIAVGGDSAGGNIAAVVAHAARDDDIDLAAQILVYPFLDLDARNERAYPSMSRNATDYYVTLADLHWCVSNYLRAGVDPTDPRVSPLRDHTFTGLPATVLAIAEFDPLADQGLAYAQRLREASVPVIEHSGTGLIHGFADISGTSPTARQELRRLLESVVETLGVAVTDLTGPQRRRLHVDTGHPHRT